MAYFQQLSLNHVETRQPTKRLLPLTGRDLSWQSLLLTQQLLAVPCGPASASHQNLRSSEWEGQSKSRPAQGEHGAHSKREQAFKHSCPGVLYRGHPLLALTGLGADPNTAPVAVLTGCPCPVFSNIANLSSVTLRNLLHFGGFWC